MTYTMIVKPSDVYGKEMRYVIEEALQGYRIISFDLPKAGNYYVTLIGKINICNVDRPSDGPRFIVAPITSITPPSWWE